MGRHRRRYPSAIPGYRPFNSLVVKVRKFKGSKRDQEKQVDTDLDICSIFPNVLGDPKLREQIQWYERWLAFQLRGLPEDFFSVLNVEVKPPTGDYLSKEFKQAFLEIGSHLGSKISPTIDDVVTHLHGEGLITRDNTPESLRSARQFVFSVLGWQTMLYRPSLNTSPPEQLAVVEEQNGYSGQAFMAFKQSENACARKHLDEFLLGFGVLLPPLNFCLSVDPKDEKAFNDLRTINSFSLNAHLLTTVGRIRIKWVDTLSCHMEFDPTEKELFLFRFPSFCQACLPAAGNEEDVKNSVIHACQTTASGTWATEEEVTKLLVETMLSFRLLFGQDKQSRKLFRSMHPFIDLPDDIDDPLLYLLCSVKSRFNTGQRTAERETYDLSQDFPILRSRITDLHTFLSNTTPRGWYELWRDKRDSAHWLTFWAVIIFGGTGILLAFLQVVFQILQVAMGV